MAGDERPPAMFVLADAAAMMTADAQNGLDDLLSKEIEKLNLEVRRMEAMLSYVTDIAESMQQKTTEVLQDARDMWLGDEDTDEDEDEEA